MNLEEMYKEHLRAGIVLNTPGIQEVGGTVRFRRFAPLAVDNPNHIQQIIGDNMCHEDKNEVSEKRAYYAVLEMKDGKYIVHSNVRESNGYMGMQKSYDYQEAINFIKKHLSSSNCYVVKVMAEVKREVEHYS